MSLVTDVTRLMRALQELLEAFENHRRATHEVHPHLCVTCQRSTDAITKARGIIHEYFE